MANFDGTDEFFDSREVIERIAELELLAETMSDDEETEEARAEAYEEYDADEYAALIALQDEAKGYISDWEYGETFISDDYFETYAEELAYDIGAVDREASWPLNRINWSDAAEDLKIDYTEFEFRGTTYYAR